MILRAAGNKGNASVPMLDEMLHRFENPAAIVGHDRWAPFSSGDKDQRMPGCAQVLHVARSGLGMQGIDGDEAIGVPGADGHKIGFGGREGPRRAQGIAAVGPRSHAAPQEHVAAQVVRGQADPAKDGIQVTERRRRPGKLPAGQHPDRRSPVPIFA